MGKPHRRPTSQEKTRANARFTTGLRSRRPKGTGAGALWRAPAVSSGRARAWAEPPAPGPLAGRRGRARQSATTGLWFPKGSEYGWRAGRPGRDCQWSSHCGQQTGQSRFPGPARRELIPAAQRQEEHTRPQAGHAAGQTAEQPAGGGAEPRRLPGQAHVADGQPERQGHAQACSQAWPSWRPHNHNSRKTGTNPPVSGANPLNRENTARASRKRRQPRATKTSPPSQS